MKPVFNPYAKKKPGQASSAAVVAPPRGGGAGEAGGGSLLRGNDAAAAAPRPTTSLSSSGGAHLAATTTKPTASLAPPKSTAVPASEELRPGIAGARQPPLRAAAPAPRGNNNNNNNAPGGGERGGAPVVGSAVTATMSAAKPVSLRAKLRADIEKIRRENQHKKLLKQQERHSTNAMIMKQQPQQLQPTKDRSSGVVGGHPSLLQHPKKENVGALPTSRTHGSTSNTTAAGQGGAGPGQRVEGAKPLAAQPPPPPREAAPRTDERRTRDSCDPAGNSPPAPSEFSDATMSTCCAGGPAGSLSDGSRGAVNAASPSTSVNGDSQLPPTNRNSTTQLTPPSGGVPFVTPSASAPHPNRESGFVPMSPPPHGTAAEPAAASVVSVPSNESPLMDPMCVGRTGLPASEASSQGAANSPASMATPTSNTAVAETMTPSSGVGAPANGAVDDAAAKNPSSTDADSTMPTNAAAGPNEGGLEAMENATPRRDLAPTSTAAAPTGTNPAPLMSREVLATQHMWQQQQQQYPLMHHSFYGYWNQQLLANPSNPAMYPVQPPSILLQVPVAWASTQHLYSRMPYNRPWYGLPWHPWSMAMPQGGQPGPPSRTYPPNAPRGKNSPHSERLKPPGSAVLAAKPLEAPSPYAYTHDMLEGAVELTKTPSDPELASFGVTLRLDVQGALVPREWLIANHYLVAPAAAPTETAATAEAAPLDSPGQPVLAGHSLNEAIRTSQAGEEPMGQEPPYPAIGNGGTAHGASAAVPSKRQAPRRKRWHFAVLAVQDPTKHNSRGPSGAGGSPVALQVGDIILKIDGKATEGLTFQQAVALLRDFDRVDGDGVARCPVVIARRKLPVVPSKLSTTTVRMPAHPLARKAPLTPAETVDFLRNVLKLLTDPLRLLGKPISDDNLRSIAQGSPTLSSLSVEFMKGAWSGIINDVRAKIDYDATAYWTSEWQKEPDASRVPGVNCMTDAQRATLRALPRPAKGCRCGSTDHEYVSSTNCPLYSNLRALAPPGFNESLDDESTTISSKLGKDLNAVEKAFKDRYVKLKTEQKAQEREAKFVSMMEEIQVARLKQAIFAPSLQCMVLSAVAEIQNAFAGLHLEPLHSATAQPVDLGSTTGLDAKENDPNATSYDSDDDDDDVPLALLGKRSTKGEDSSAKRPRQEVPVRLCFIARLLKELSIKWGHVYSEPTDEEYAWRWEVYHGQTSATSSVWDANSKNPRRPGSLSLECVRFGIVDDFPTNLDVPSLPSLQDATFLRQLAALAAPEFSGVADELQALIRMGVLHVDERGLPRLAKDWWNQVDLLILEDMNNLWGLKADPHRKVGIVDEIRVLLKEKWRRTRDGWVMTDEPDEIVFDFDEFDLWREAFEEKQQEEQEDDEGIGKFGI